MASGNMDKDFKLVTPDPDLDPIVKAFVGDDVTLPCHISPVFAIDIRWFKGTDCIYLNRNGHVTVREGFEGRVSVNIQKLLRGDVSLILGERREEDVGVYTCQVISGEHKEEGRVGLTRAVPSEEAARKSYMSRPYSPTKARRDAVPNFQQMCKEMEGGRKREDSNQRSLMEVEITAEERKKMEESVLSLALLAWQKATDELETSKRQLESLEKEMQRKSKLEDQGLSEETNQDD